MDDARTLADSASGAAVETPAAWHAFEKGLTEVLSVLEEDQYLVISAKRGWAYVQFAAQGSFGMRAESISNKYLPPSGALTADQMGDLQKLGWSPPTPRGGTEGSPNFFRDFARPVPFGDVARLAVQTLTEVLRIPHPGYLEYQSFETNGRVILLPTLRLKHRPSEPGAENTRADTVERIRELLLGAIRKTSGDADLDFDQDGRLALRFGSAILLVRVRQDPTCISLVSPLLAKMETTDVLRDRLNELNAKVRFARLFLREGIVYAAMEVSAAPFVAEHVVNACWLLGKLADDIDDMLQWEFGGRTALGEFRSKPLVH